MIRIHLLGYRNDVINLYKISDVYVHPSYREGLPVAVMEALATGTTVIASNIRGCEDIVRNNLFNPNDVDSLTEIIRNYHTNGVLEVSFAQGNVIERVIALYEDIAPIEYK